MAQVWQRLGDQYDDATPPFSRSAAEQPAHAATTTSPAGRRQEGIRLSFFRRAWMRLLLKRASASRPSGDWNADDFDVAADGAVVGRIFRANAAPVGMPWMRTLACTMRTERPHTAMPRVARRQWLHSPRAGGGS